MRRDSAVKIGIGGNTDQEELAHLREIGYQSEAELQGAVNHARLTWTPRVMFVLVPVFAALVGVVFRRSGRNYPQHLYFALHVHAAWFAAGAAVVAVSLVLPSRVAAVIGIGLLVYGLAYPVLALSTAYGVRKRRAVTRSLVVLPVYGLVVMIAVIVVMLLLVLGRAGVFKMLQWMQSLP